MYSEFLTSFGNYRLTEKKARYGMYIEGGMLADEVFKNSRYT
jgi:hypothetical protein